MTICERLFSFLDDKSSKKNAAELCRILGVRTSQTTSWKQRNTDPPAKYIIQIAEYLGVSVEYMLTGEERDNSESTAVDEDEKELLGYFRYCDKRGKRRILVYAEEQATEEKNETTPTDAAN